jgi:hypothetical protein
VPFAVWGRAMIIARNCRLPLNVIKVLDTSEDNCNSDDDDDDDDKNNNNKGKAIPLQAYGAQRVLGG